MSEELTFPGRVELAAVRWHAGGRRRVLALHGWLDNAASFAGVAAELPDCELVALDFAGHGRSGHLPAGGWYHFIDYLGDALDALDGLGWERCVLLGHSLGGAVATALAAACPDRVEQLVLIEALGPLAMPEGRAAEVLRRGIEERRAIAGKRKRVIPSMAAAVAARMQATAMDEASARALVERGLEVVEGGYQWTSDPRLTVTTPARLNEAQVQEWIAAVDAPTLLIAAREHPPYFDEALRTARVAALRHGRERVLPGRHHLHLDTPAPVAAAIREFLAG